MGTISIQVTSAAGTRGKTFAVSDANIDRLIAWGRSLQTPPATPDEAIQLWARWVMNMSKAHLVEDERRKANIPDFDAS